MGAADMTAGLCRLTVRHSGGGGSQSFALRLGGVLRLGRKAGNDVVLDHHGVSAHHAELLLAEAGGDGSALCVRDASTNGTGVRPGPEVESLDDGDGSGYWEPVTKGALRALGQGSWQLKVPLKSRRGGQQLPEWTRTVTLYVRFDADPDLGPPPPSAAAVGPEEPQEGEDLAAPPPPPARDEPGHTGTAAAPAPTVPAAALQAVPRDAARATAAAAQRSAAAAAAQRAAAAAAAAQAAAERRMAQARAVEEARAAAAREVAATAAREAAQAAAHAAEALTAAKCRRARMLAETEAAAAAAEAQAATAEAAAEARLAAVAAREAEAAELVRSSPEPDEAGPRAAAAAKPAARRRVADGRPADRRRPAAVLDRPVGEVLAASTFWAPLHHAVPVAGAVPAAAARKKQPASRAARPVPVVVVSSPGAPGAPPGRRASLAPPGAPPGGPGPAGVGMDSLLRDMSVSPISEPGVRRKRGRRGRSRGKRKRDKEPAGMAQPARKQHKRSRRGE